MTDLFLKMISLFYEETFTCSSQKCLPIMKTMISEFLHDITNASAHSLSLIERLLMRLTWGLNLGDGEYSSCIYETVSQYYVS